MCASRHPATDPENAGIPKDQSLLLAQIVESAPDIIGAFNAQGRLVYLNRAGRRWCGLPENSGEMQELACAQLHSPAAAKMIKEIALPAAAREGIWRGESVVCDREGREHPGGQIIVAFRQADGTVTGFRPTFAISPRDA